MKMPTLVLSSSSPARRSLLERLRQPFVIAPPHIDETPLAHESPETLVARLASQKAHANQANYPNALIIGCDQVAVINGTIVSKPENHETAVTQLRAASGQCIDFFTGLCLLNTQTQRIQESIQRYRVFYRQLTDEMIENYLRIEQPYQCAGSIQIEGLGIVLIERLEGTDPTALIGLPLIALTHMLEQEGIYLV